MPIAASVPKAAKLLPRGTLKVYPGADHGMFVTHADQVNADILAFIRNDAVAEGSRNETVAEPV